MSSADVQRVAMNLLNSLPQTIEEGEALEILKFDARSEHGITDDDLAEIIPFCPNLKDAYLSGIRDLSDRTLILLGQETDDLRLLDVSRCKYISPIGMRDIAGLATKLQVLRVHGVWGLTDSVVTTLVRSLGHLTELDLSSLPLVTAHSVREIWTFSKKLRTLNLSNCSNVTDRGFPSPYSYRPPPRQNQTLVVPPPLPRPEPQREEGPTGEKPYKDDLQPLILPPHHNIRHLHYLSFNHLPWITDDAIVGLLMHVPRVIELQLAGCVGITDKIAQSLCNVGGSLEILDLSEINSLTDNGIFKLVRGCPKLRQVNISYCTKLTDMSVLELALLDDLRRLYMIGLPKVTDIALQFLAEHTPGLTHLQISGCFHFSLDAVHLILRRLTRLQRLGACIPPMYRIGVKRFSEPEPHGWDHNVRGSYRAFRGSNIAALRKFLDKEDDRRKEAERRCIPFTPKEDDSTDLY